MRLHLPLPFQQEIAYSKDCCFQPARARSVKSHSPLLKQFVKPAADQTLEEREFVIVMVIEGGAVQRSRICYVLDGNLIEHFFFQ